MTRQGGFHVPPFHDSRGTTHEGLTPPTFLNVAVLNVIRHWLSLTIDNHDVTHNGVGELVGQKLGFFYSDDVMINSRKP